MMRGGMGEERNEHDEKAQMRSRSRETLWRKKREG